VSNPLLDALLEQRQLLDSVLFLDLRKLITNTWHKPTTCAALGDDDGALTTVNGRKTRHRGLRKKANCANETALAANYICISLKLPGRHSCASSSPDAIAVLSLMITSLQRRDCTPASPTPIAAPTASFCTNAARTLTATRTDIQTRQVCTTV